jgi:uncharacterized membrane protein YfcA
MNENDPLNRLRHALVGLGLALVLAVLTAAMAGAFFGDLVADSYDARVSVYGALLFYVVVGAVVLFKRVAQYETQPVSPQRVLLWWLSLWLWPLLFLLSKPPPQNG